MLKLQEIKIFEDTSEKNILKKALKKNKVDFADVISYKIIKKSVDSRDKSKVHFCIVLAIEVKDENKYPNLVRFEPIHEIKINRLKNSDYRPVVVGSGPAGMFCALVLAENGQKPIVIEQGMPVEERVKQVEEYRNTGKLNPKCNVQFGEGGAGTFSDGKLTTGINSEYINYVLNRFHKFGAPEEITYLAKPHMGTDNLVKVVKNIRQYIESLGGTYYFNTTFKDYKNNDGVVEVICDDKSFTTDALVLAIGHSARNTLKMLQNHNIEMKRKNFSIGVRIEHLQDTINKAQYGEATKLTLPAAEYKLVYHGAERSCYSFCMCPGGEVMASGSDEDGIVTNGMSNFARDGINANGALLVNVLTTDFEGDDPLSGMYFQQQLEKAAYQLGGNNGNAPIQRVEDFENGVKSVKIGKVTPTYKPGYTLTDLNQLLPEFVSKTLKEALPYFDKKVKGFNDPDAILTAIESRTSSVATIIRDESLQCVKGIYPCGEGAGYAGGITSAAVDGIKVAIKILEN